MNAPEIQSIIEIIAATLTTEQLADDRRVTELAIAYAVGSGLRPSQIGPHIDTIKDRAWALKMARAA